MRIAGARAVMPRPDRFNIKQQVGRSAWRLRLPAMPCQHAGNELTAFHAEHDASAA